MKKRLFLTGPSGIGKSTIIRQALGPALAYAGGFVTERVSDGEGRLLGYELLPAAAALSGTAYQSWRWITAEAFPPRTMRSFAIRVSACSRRLSIIPLSCWMR